MTEPEIANCRPDMTQPPFCIHLIERGGTARHWPMTTWEATVEWFSRVTETWPESTAMAYAGDEIRLCYYKGRKKRYGKG